MVTPTKPAAAMQLDGCFSSEDDERIIKKTQGKFGTAGIQQSTEAFPDFQDDLS